MADKTVAGRIIVEEYLTDKFASNSDDEKRLRQAEARARRKKKAKSSRIIVPRARHLATTSFKTSGLTASANVFSKRTSQASRSFRSSLEFQNNKHPDLDRQTFNLGGASKATAANNCPAHRWQRSNTEGN